MTRMTKNNACALLVAFGALAMTLLPEGLEACTGLTLHAKNGDVVYGRTMEWGTFDIHARLVCYPRDFQYKADIPGEKAGMAWKGRYGVVGIDVLKKGCIFDGMNEAGLTAGLFYHPGYAEYPELSAENAAHALAPTDAVTYLLSTCSSIEDVRKALGKATLVAVVEKAIGFPAPVHVILTEAGGEQIIIEWLDKGVQIHDSKIGVLTNAPEYPWHLTNLRNYVNMSMKARPGIELNGVAIAPLGGGSGMLGLPGDFTPPSRFIRAAAFASTARTVENGEEALYELFRILDNFNVPLGSSEGDGADAVKGLHSATAWTTGHDQANRRFFYHTQYDRQLQMVDMRKLDFTAFDSLIARPLDTGRQSVKDRTDDLKR